VAGVGGLMGGQRPLLVERAATTRVLALHRQEQLQLHATRVLALHRQGQLQLHVEDYPHHPYKTTTS
jgi:hypothetical protein